MSLVFYDIETTIPPADIIEFGAIVLDRQGLFEQETFSTLIRSDKINNWSIDCNGITREMTKDAPEFAAVADRIFSVLDGRIWAGHNIKSFDNVHLAKAFEKIGSKPPEPLLCVDTLQILRRTFGTRAGDMKMASLGKLFGLGQEQHRAIDDCRMTIEVLKNCSMTMLMEEHAGYCAEEEPCAGEVATPGDSVLDAVNQAMSEKRDIWISYDGGSNPCIPRQIRPEKWVHELRLLEAFCHQSQINKNFTRRKIVEVRNEEWAVSRADDEE